MMACSNFVTKLHFLRLLENSVPLNTPKCLNKTQENTHFPLHTNVQEYSNPTSHLSLILQPGHSMVLMHPVVLFSQWTPCVAFTCYRSPVMCFLFFSCICHNVSEEADCDGNRITYFQSYQKRLSNVGKSAKLPVQHHPNKAVVLCTHECVL